MGVIRFSKNQQILYFQYKVHALLGIDHVSHYTVVHQRIAVETVSFVTNTFTYLLPHHRTCTVHSREQQDLRSKALAHADVGPSGPFSVHT